MFDLVFVCLLSHSYIISFFLVNVVAITKLNNAVHINSCLHFLYIVFFHIFCLFVAHCIVDDCAHRDVGNKS